uniref:Uncharacterized protein n=1 Tax=Anguilla anguilla TaxID=7936 RepID=A0A0E9WV94_ANGAN
MSTKQNKPANIYYFINQPTSKPTLFIELTEWPFISVKSFNKSYLPSHLFT